MRVYKITNIINNKIYIGITTRSIEERYKEHLTCKSSYIGKSLRKNKKENFSIECIHEAKDIKELNTLEVYYIKKYNSIYPYGYNIESGGDLKKLHIETKLKIQKRNKKFFYEDINCQITLRSDNTLRLRAYVNEERIHLGNFINIENAIKYYKFCKDTNKWEKFIYPRISKYENKYRLRITCKGKRITLGLFNNNKDALSFYFKEYYNGYNFYESGIANAHHNIITNMGNRT